MDWKVLGTIPIDYRIFVFIFIYIYIKIKGLMYFFRQLWIIYTVQYVYLYIYISRCTSLFVFSKDEEIQVFEPDSCKLHPLNFH